MVATAFLAGCMSSDQTTVFNQINSARSANGVAALTAFSPAQNKAQAWAQYLAQQGSLSHSNLPDGYSGVQWCQLGENVGMGPDLASIQTAFMNSPGHRANILNPVYNNVGTGVVQASNGYYFVVQEFVDAC